MNERVEKLALRAREYADELLGSGLPDTVWQDRYHEKFAELIVRECIGIVKEYAEDGPYCQCQMIKEHFGVEE